MPLRPKIKNVPKTACQKREIKQAMDDFKKGRLYNATGKQRITKESQATAIAYYYAYLNCDGQISWVQKNQKRKSRSTGQRKRKRKKRS